MQWGKSWCARAVISGFRGSQGLWPGLSMLESTWGRSCSSLQCGVNTTAVQAAFHSVTHLLWYHQTLLTKISWQTARIWGTTFLLLAGDRAVTLLQCSSLLQHSMGCIRPENKRNWGKNGWCQATEPGTTQRWQKQLALKWHVLCGSKGHNSTSASPNTAIPGKAQLALLAGRAPSLGSKYGERHFSCFSFGCAFYFPCLGALRVVVGCSRWWVLFF